MSTLYIRLPSKAAADSLQPGMPLYCQYAVGSNSGALEREGVAALSELADPVARAQRVVLLLAASDVTLLRVKVPPLPPAKLKAALPNLVEDDLMSDPAECVVVPGETLHDLRTVGVVQRSWLELLARTLQSLGARRVSAIPSQLCLPYAADSVTAAAMEQGEDIEVAVRLAEQEGIGLAIMADQPESAAFDVIQSLAAVVSQAAMTLYVPPPRLRDYQESLHLVPALEERIKLAADSWTQWMEGADSVSLDLMSGLGAAAGRKFNWRPWRWPLALAAVLLVINALGLNIDWLRMKREADALRASMMQTYRATFPKDQVIVDPLAQMRQKLAAAQRNSGQIAPDDFIALAAAVGEVLNTVAPGTSPVAALEYRERSLRVKLKPGSAVPIEPVRNALATRNLSISQPETGVWQIRSAR
ncbi:MAG TPA: type II secretion system protein GspL [Noviherbaspirillum sp.]|nr:type II secretion system protein GspL [Noviherbaspirillum sp.]